jgi:S-adenosylmethionine synthetase
VLFQHELQPGAPELVDLFAREYLGANDTSAAVGYAPLTETERCVLAAEQWLNGLACKAHFPEVGEDVKVMGCRQGRTLTLTIALAFVDHFLPNERTYFERKATIKDTLLDVLAADLQAVDSLDIQINTLDRPGRGLGGMYLTVLGTSAESGDSGQVGRGNRVNGVISLNHPMSTEAAAGKNPVSHVGKIYNLFSHHIAQRIYTTLDPVEEVYVWLCSQIGQPIIQPWITSAHVTLAPGVTLADVERAITEMIEGELADLPAFVAPLVRSAFPVR